ncbi:uncharacterized protein SCHCODRAFT_02703079 [Schizophyllum commune H4-8]|uniref:Uncharacterized protein n=1 Tax=Schizophyllum commune (strain H4-8 / FGSC 9210) TaxID=578458 RepID=D8Q974_SCHCM|nr:uncharacterized protein SCHCODRAFT_02703079 [Schizophyllum commune H4-8]KAI5890525.1 hypothetical protein SCHCODRAFT_02703079 [Schizophyllum commune H4-8]
MFAPILALLSGVALANAYGLKSASTSPYGQSSGNWELQKTAYGALLVGGKDVPLTTSVTIEGGQLKLVCPQQASAALVRTGSDDPKYTVQFVSKTDDLPKGSIFTGWTTQSDGVSLPDELTKVVNTEVGLDGTYNLATVDGANALTWSNKGPSNGVQWFLAIDEANDVHC